VEDWEQFFAEKSRRRFEVEREEMRRDRLRLALAAGLIGLLVIVAIVGLAIVACSDHVKARPRASEGGPPLCRSA
jgi:hypothetical protein